MNINIHDWKLSVDSTPIAQILNFVKDIDATQVVRKSLGGIIYIQTVKPGTPYANALILATTAEKDTINVLQAEGSIFSIVYREVKYTGYMEAKPEWEVVSPGEWYQGIIKFLIEEETSL